MKYNDELINLIRAKKFKTIWHCFDYLLTAGYDILTAFGIGLKEYGSEKIFSRVAFVRCEVIQIVEPTTYMPTQNCIVTVGLIDDTNIHLHNIYKVYRKWLQEKRASNTSPYDNIIDLDIENTCERIVIKNVSPLMLDYIDAQAVDQFGHKIYKDERGNRSQYTIPHITPTYIGDPDPEPNRDEITARILKLAEEHRRKDLRDGFR